MTDKAVLISINPHPTAQIISGEKKVEIRKTKPNLPTPFPCYIYESSGNRFVGNQNLSVRIRGTGRKKVIGEFVCDKIDEYRAEFCDFEYSDCMNDKCALNQILKVIAYDDYDKTPIYLFETSNEEENSDDCELVRNSKVMFNEIRKYIGETFFDKSFYAWHISNLVIYDEPKELSEFKKINRNCWYADLGLAKRDCPECNNAGCFLSRPPMSWCYVEVLKCT